FTGIARAAMRLAEAKVKGLRRRPQGASTITQQVAKNFLLTKDQTFERKIKEAILAIRIERAYSKERILELYLNEIYLGIGSYGVAAAALNYFGKELDELTVEEAAYLAALPKAPSNYHPYKNTKRATIRRDWIIDQMRKNGYITQDVAERAKSTPLTVKIRKFGTQVFAADYFAEEVRRGLLAKYGEKGLYGAKNRVIDPEKKRAGVNGGLSVRTTLDPTLQRHARRALIDGLVKFDRAKGWRGPISQIDVSRGDWGKALTELDQPSDLQPWRLGVTLKVTKTYAEIGLKPRRQKDGKLSADAEIVQIGMDQMKWAKRKGRAPRRPADVVKVGDVVYVAPSDADKPNGPWTLMQMPAVSGGIIAMDPHTGRVLAVVGGFSFDASQFDRAVQAKRQPGSSFKPFVYAAALDNGYKPTSIVIDEPITVEQPGKEVWEPKNYGGKFYGPSTLRTGIERSRNLMTVRLAQHMGMPTIAEYARRFGIYDRMLPVLSMALGAGETTLIRLTTAYCMIANGGKQVRATLIDRIQNRHGETIWSHDQRKCVNCNSETWQGQGEPDIADERRQIIDPHTAYQITSMMEGVVKRGTARVLTKMLPGVPIAGKTGTTNQEKDAWFVGFTPDLVVGVFVGFDTPKPMGKGSTGGGIAAPIFGAFMQKALAGKPRVPFRAPAGVNLVRVDSRTGLPSSAGNAIVEAFKPNSGPDDIYSFIGFENQDSGGTPQNASRQPRYQQQPTYRDPGFQAQQPRQPRRRRPRRRQGGWNPFGFDTGN
ncbi:MAG: penicillin-binding protein 1A, partial [Pseudomonadota bacterium]